VTPKLHITESLLDPDTVGLIVPRFDLVVDLVQGRERMATTILKGVTEWTVANRPRES